MKLWYIVLDRDTLHPIKRISKTSNVKVSCSHMRTVHMSPSQHKQMQVGAEICPLHIVWHNIETPFMFSIVYPRNKGEGIYNLLPIFYFLRTSNIKFVLYSDRKCFSRLIFIKFFKYFRSEIREFYCIGIDLILTELCLTSNYTRKLSCDLYLPKTIL